MSRELYRIEEAYKQQLLNEGIIWDGVKWVWNKITNGVKKVYNDSNKPSATTHNNIQSTPSKSNKIDYLTDLSDSAVYRLLDNADIDNPRYDKANFTKLLGQNGYYWCALVQDGKALAICAILPHNPYYGCYFLNEIQSLRKGYGKTLFENVIQQFKAVWLTSDYTASDSLNDYYRHSGMFNELTVRDKKGVRHNIFYTRFVNESRLKEYVLSAFNQ